MKKRNLFLVNMLIVFTTLTVYAGDFQKYLMPVPQKVFTSNLAADNFNTTDIQSILDILNATENINIEGNFGFRNSQSNLKLVRFEIDSLNLKPQGYKLEITPSAIILRGQDKAALFYGRQTLIQLIDYSLTEKKALPNLTVEDWPDFERRGYMLDISRDKVPSMKTLYLIIDMLAKWKINEFQLYTEHTFAYKNHKPVWENASPLTANEIKLLDAYCRERFIDLVPNQNSFGHMENWLKHDEYLDLAECPDDCKTAWGTRKRHSLNPTNPQSLELMKELYSELLPNFSSEYFNIGCDETIELGTGISKAACAKKGKGKIYLSYLLELNNEVAKQDRKAQFWGDIILNHPELIPQLPKNMTALVWGYSANYPFNENLPKFKKAGIDFYVCPGTSTWRSLIGRNKNAVDNLKNAAVQGKINDAKGFLNTNWGDYGHWQPLSVCHPSVIIGACYAWHYEENTLNNLEFQLNHYVFKDKTGNTAKALLKLGDSYLKTSIPSGNANAYHLMLRRYKWSMNGQYQTKQLTVKGLISAEKEIDAALALLKQANPECTDAAIVLAEMEQAAMLAKHGIHLGIARLNAKKLETKNIPKGTLIELQNELRPLIESHKKLWIIRNRPGGLSDSAEKLEGLLEYYSDK